MCLLSCLFTEDINQSLAVVLAQSCYVCFVNSSLSNTNNKYVSVLLVVLFFRPHLTLASGKIVLRYQYRVDIHGTGLESYLSNSTITFALREQLLAATERQSISHS